MLWMMPPLLSWRYRVTDNHRVEPSRTSTQLAVVLEALATPQCNPAARRLADAFGSEPVAIRDRLVGEPAYRSRRLLFASGAEIILHDDAIAAVLLRLAPTQAAPRGLDLSKWIASADNDATLSDLEAAIGSKPQFVGFGQPYFALDGGYARATFKDNRGWKDPGNLVGITITAQKPGTTCRPEDDDCPTCSNLLMRSGDSASIDVGGTADALAAALSAGLLTEDAHWVKLADLQPLHASGLMERVESQLTCTACKRIICFTLPRDGSATFGYYVLDGARRRPLEAIPPVEQWGDATRLAQDRDAMHYVDHEPGAWFLVEQQGSLYLDARYVITSMFDDSALIRLDDAEVTAYQAGGHDYMSRLARGIHDGSPHKEESPYFQRNLLRGPDGKAYREAVTSAIVNHTWIAQQRRTT